MEWGRDFMRRGRPARGGPTRTMHVFMLNALLLAGFVAAGVVVIVTIRARMRSAARQHESWETTLAGYRELRDKGVLTADEYRKIKTLVEPTGVPGGVEGTVEAGDGRPSASRRVG